MEVIHKVNKGLIKIILLTTSIQSGLNENVTHYLYKKNEIYIVHLSLSCLSNVLIILA